MDIDTQVYIQNIYAYPELFKLTESNYNLRTEET